MNTMKPILFSGPMIQAIRARAKHQTRRVIEPQPTTMVNFGGKPVDTGAWDWRCRNQSHKCLSTSWDIVMREMLAYYDHPGDLRWVQETHTITDWDTLRDDPYLFELSGYYDADHASFQTVLTERESALFHARKKGCATVPGRFMYRSLSRLTLEITDIRVERLQDISEEDAQAEGIQEVAEAAHLGGAPFYLDYEIGEWTAKTNSYEGLVSTAVASFQTLWDSIHDRPGQRAKAIRGETHPWESNCHVWVLEFRRKEAQ